MAGTISIITVNLNGAAHLQTLLTSIATQTTPPHELIVVDNGSVDDSEQITRAAGATWHPTGANIGLAPGLQLGAELATGDNLLFLNNDVILPPAFLDDIVQGRNRHPDAAAFDVVQRDAAGTIVHSLVRFRRTRSVRTDIPRWDIGFTEPTEGQATPTPLASAAHFFISRTMFDRLGGWDTGFFLGHEDLDLCWRAWAMQHPVMLLPNIECTHDVGATSRTPAGHQARVYGTVYGRLRFAAKHLPVEHVLAVVAGVVVTLPHGVAAHDLKPRLRALARFARDVPALMRERGRFYESVGVKPRQHFRHMTTKFAA